MNDPISRRRACSCIALVIATAVTAFAHPSQSSAPLRLQARVSGQGAPVVLLGGGLLGADGWGQVPAVLARTRRVINLQSLVVQHGLEGRDLPKDYSIHTEVDALARTLDAMHVASADVIGMSHGGVVALAFAMSNPNRVRTLTVIEPPAFWVLPNHGNDEPGARDMQAFVRSLRDREITEDHVERFRCLLGDCAEGRSPRQLPQWPQWVTYRRSLRGLYTLSDYTEPPARLRMLNVPALVVTGAETVSFHRAVNDALLRTLPRAESLRLDAGHNSPAAEPEHFVAEWQKFLGRQPALRIVLLGTGGAPNSNAERAGPAAWVEAGEQAFLIDAGRNVVSQMRQAAIGTSRVTRVFLTHLHSDHIVGLPDLWLSGWWMSRQQPLDLYGPPGTRAMTEDLQRAFSADIDLRTGPPERLPRETSALNGFDVVEGVVYEAGGVRVSAIRVDHGPVPTFGYRVDYAGRSVVFSGDDRRSENLIAKSQSVDVLFHNMSAFTPEQLNEQSRIGEVRRAALQLLGTPEDAADVFSRSRCKVAMLIHANRDEASLNRVRARYQGRLEAPDDLTEVLVGDDVVLRPLKR